MQVELTKQNEKRIVEYVQHCKTIIPSYDASPTAIVNQMVALSLDEAVTSQMTRIFKPKKK